jgi:protein CpxP
MKRWIKRSLFALFGVSVLVAGLSACGHRSHEFGAQLSAEEYSQKRDKIVSRAASKLDLNDDQKKRLATLGDKLYEQRTALIGQTKDPRAEMKALVAGATFDKAAPRPSSPKRPPRCRPRALKSSPLWQTFTTA